MLAISISQVQQMELKIAQLRFHLREHEFRAAAVAVLTGQAAAAILGGQSAAVVLNITSAPTAEALLGAAAGLGVPPGVDGQRDGEAGGVAGGDAAAPLRHPEHQARLRLRLWAAVKLAIVMLLLEVRSGWFFVYFFLVFLYVGGLFDPLIEWFQRTSTQTTLEQQLNDLRNRRHVVPTDEDTIAPEAAATPPQDSNASSGTGGLPEEVHGEVGANASGVGLGEDTASRPNDAQAGAGSSGDAGTGSGISDEGSPPEVSSGAGNSDATAPPAAEEPAVARPPYAHRFIYQLFIMFVMTLLPWWNPDPRYL